MLYTFYHPEVLHPRCYIHFHIIMVFFIRLERLYGMITDLYIDHNKFKGHNVKNKVGISFFIIIIIFVIVIVIVKGASTVRDPGQV